MYSSEIVYKCFALFIRQVRCDQLKNKSSWRVTYGNPCYSIGSKANSIYFLNDRSVLPITTNTIQTFIHKFMEKGNSQQSNNNLKIYKMCEI
jgi:hypothetical protein